jgi:hypothetical protein
MPKDLTLQTTASGDTSRGPTQRGATPAPWCIKSFDDCEEIWPVDAGEWPIATIDHEFAREVPRALANARLIAQSPALLAALKAATEALTLAEVQLGGQAMCKYGPLAEHCREVLAAAEGSDRP